MEEMYCIRTHIQARQHHYEKGMGRRPLVGLWREERTSLGIVRASFLLNVLVPKQLCPGYFLSLSSHLSSIIAGGELRALDYQW